MTRDEYEARKRRLEDELRSGMELLQAAFQTQFRALEMVWMGASGEPVSIPQAAPAPAAAPPPVAPEAKRPRRSVGEVYTDLLTALAEPPGDLRPRGYLPRDRLRARPRRSLPAPEGAGPGRDSPGRGPRRRAKVHEVQTGLSATFHRVPPTFPKLPDPFHPRVETFHPARE